MNPSELNRIIITPEELDRLIVPQLVLELQALRTRTDHLESVVVRLVAQLEGDL